jgi:pimeloyl-ACP methyl ester carboxylesterase
MEDEWKTKNFHESAESDLRPKYRAWTKLWAEMPDDHIMRETQNGIEVIEERESYLASAGRVEDQRATDLPWGFDLEQVRTRKILILAGGLDMNTPSSGARWMRDQLPNCKLEVVAREDHDSLQKNNVKKIRQCLLGL